MIGYNLNNDDVAKLHEQLSATLCVTTFDLEYTVDRGDGNSNPVSKRSLSPCDLSMFYSNRSPEISSVRAFVHTPDTRMSCLVAELRLALNKFINPETDQIGHAFPIDYSNGNSMHRARSDGLSEFEYQSSVKCFTKGLIQASAIIGVERVIQLLLDWDRGTPIHFKTSTIVYGLILDSYFSPRDDIEITPLALTTSKLPRLPNYENRSRRIFLGLTVLSLEMSSNSCSFPS